MAIIPDKTGSLLIDKTKTEAFRWICDLGRLSAGLEVNLIWKEQAGADTKTYRESQNDSILSALDKFNWHRGKAAKFLGINQSTIWRHLKKLGMTTNNSRSLFVL